MAGHFALKRLSGRAASAGAASATGEAMASAASSVVEFVALAALMIIAIHAFAQLIETGQWIARCSDIQLAAERLVQRVDAADSAVVDALAGADPTPVRLDAAAPAQTSGFEASLRDGAAELPELADPIRRLLEAVHAQMDIVRRAAGLVAPGGNQEGLVAVTGPAGQQARATVETALDRVIETADERAKSWRSDQTSSLQTDFWLALAVGCAGLFTVLGMALRNMLMLERQQALRATLASTQAALSRSERARNEFIQVVGHDLRQPLQAIGLFARGLERRISDAAAKPLLDGLRSSAASLNRMLGGLIDISRLDTGAVTIEAVNVQLDAVLEPIRAEFAQVAEAKGLDLRIPECPFVVHTDPVMLESILRNLVSNGVRYTHAGSVEVSCMASGETVVMRVADTGVGIPNADQEKIFHDFFRVAGTSHSGEGLGLGLGIVRRLAGLLHVHIDLASKVDQGTSFTLTLPRVASAAPKPATLPPASLAAVRHDAGAAPELQLAGMHVLLVDDDAAVCRAMRTELEFRGIIVSVAGNPDAACALFHDGGAGAFDFILMDRDLQSSMTGTELLDHLAARYGVMLPALILSGTADFRIIRELQESGYPWLAKPVPVPALLREMHRLAGREQAAAA